MKKKLYSFLLASFLATTSLFAAADITTDLRMHYNFESVDSLDGKAYILDQTTNQLNGQVMGNVTLTPGLNGIGKSYPLTDTAKYIQVPPNIFEGVSDFTISLWLKQNATVKWARFFDFGSAQSNYMFLTITGDDDTGRLRFEMKSTSSSLVNVMSQSTPWVNNEWYHVAIVGSYVIHEGQDTSAVIKMFVNGMKVGESTAFKIAPYMLGTALNHARFGDSQYDSDPTCNSNIDDFRFYTRALTEEDLAGVNGITPGLLDAYANFKLPADSLYEMMPGTSIFLPSTYKSGEETISINWATTDSTVILKTGKPVHSDIAVTDAYLVAQLTSQAGATINKKFLVTVYPVNPPIEILADYNFLSANITRRGDTTFVKDEGEVGFEAFTVGGAQILPIGDVTGLEGDEYFNVYVSGNEATGTTSAVGKQWLDLGKSIGDYIYKLRDHTMSIFYRRDTTVDHMTWEKYGQLLYAFGNSDDLGGKAYGGMYFEPKRARVSIVSGNYNQEKAGFYIEQGEGKTPLGNTWHNVTYTQSRGVGYLLFDGIQVATGAMPAPKEELRKNSNVSTRTGTWFNRLGGALYSDNITANNTMLYGFKALAIGMAPEDVEDYFRITAKIQRLNAALAVTNYDVAAYMQLLPAMADARKTLQIGFHKEIETEVKAALDVAIADSISMKPVAANVKALKDAVQLYKELSADWVKMGPILKSSFDDERALNYPGLPVLEAKIAEVQTAYNAFEIEADMFTRLDTAVFDYLKSQAKSALAPADYTWTMVNPGFETGLTGGTKLAGTTTGSYSALDFPKGWNCMVNTGTAWVGAKYYTTEPSEGAKAIEVWTGGTVNEVDYSQVTFPLEAGWYVLSGDIRGGGNNSNGTQHIYAIPDMTPEAANRIRIKSDTLTTNSWVAYGWTQPAWKKLFVLFHSDGGPAQVGFHSNAIMQFDNMKLSYYGANEPAMGNVTNSLKNPGFEQGLMPTELTGFDAASSVKAELGDVFAPLDWKVLANVDTTANNANFNILSTGAYDGAKAYRIAADTVKSVTLYQPFKAPSTGIYLVTANVRADSAYKSDARLFTKVLNRVEEGKKLFVAVDTVKTFQGWKKLAMYFRANFNEDAQVGLMTSGNVDVDNYYMELISTSTVGIKGTKTDANKYQVYAKDGVISISGLNNNERVSVYDIAGRQISVKNPSQIKVSKGMYLIKINNEVIKQLVK